MKKIMLFAAVLFCLGNTAHAQVGLQVNIGVQPVWGPVGYDHVDYYYIPDIESYYSVSTGQYTYMDGGRWVTTGYLPPRYANYDIYHGYKVVVNQPTPWMHHDMYRRQYAQYRGRHDQAVIRDSHDQRYFANPGHPQHAQWHGNAGHGQGPERHEDHGRDEGHW